jgi:hypothetical protein
MKYLRLWLATVWLIFAAVAPAHAAGMTRVTCDRMAMPHTPARHTPLHTDDTMPCCSVPAVIATASSLVLPERLMARVTVSKAPIRQLNGLTPASDPHPPKNLEV